mgnify:FL=1
MDEKVGLIAGRLNNRNGETLYWKLEKMVPCKLGDFAIVENANGYDLVEICGFITTTKTKASYFSKTKYENMKSVIMIIEKEQLICKKEEN